MKKVLIVFIGIIMSLALISCTKKGNNAPSGDVTPPSENEVTIDNSFTQNSKILIAYFSKTNTTKRVAEQIQSITNADIFEISRKEPYPEAYTPTTEVAKDEKNSNARPELEKYLPKEIVENYDTIFIGYPIWWGTAPMPVLSFLNFYDLTGKTIYTFCTAATSSITGSTDDIRTNAKGANVVEGKRFSASDSNGITGWVESLDINDSETPLPTENHILIVYFSATNTTKKVAEYIANVTKGTLFELVPVSPYSSADLNWSNQNSRVSREHNDVKLRDVELVSTTVNNFNEYDTIFIGYPIWWGIAAWPVNTFIKSNNFGNKTIIPFATSISSGIGNSGELLADMANGGNWISGSGFRSSTTESDVRNWINQLNIL